MTCARTTAFLLWLVLPLAVAVAGVVWVDRATAHFQLLTGRAFYGLAGYHYSVPEWGFAYHPGGETIHRWTTIIPGYSTAAALLLSGILAAVRNHRSGWPTVVALAVNHVTITAGFVLVVGYYDINITGVFI
jgi:hypothetical protein